MGEIYRQAGGFTKVSKQPWLTRYQRDYLKQLVLECEVQRFTTDESLAYIKAKLKIDVSLSLLGHTRTAIRRSMVGKIEHLRKHKTAYIEQYFRRITEIEKLQQENWRVYHMNTHKPLIQHMCLTELHQLSITLGNLYELMPAFTGQSLVTYEDDIPAYTRMVTEEKGPMEGPAAGAGNPAEPPIS